MISPAEEEYILNEAYVPEHIVSLMSLISKGEPFLIEDHLCFSKDNWLIFIGYPLKEDFAQEKFERTLNNAVKRFRISHARFIAPETPRSLIRSCREIESDYYYRLDIEDREEKKGLRRIVEKASKELTVERGGKITKEHKNLISEFIERVKPAHPVEKLFLSMEQYVPSSNTAHVLNARDKSGNLSAFYIVESAAKKFAAYVAGCYSKKKYVPHASDLLLYEMISLAREHRKSYIHLGLGVHEGIRRFKKKWGGLPFLRYEYGEYFTGNNRTLGLINYLKSKS